MPASLTAEELAELVRRVFAPRPEDRRLAFLVDLPDERVADHPAWRERRQMVAGWCRALGEQRETLGLENVDLIHFRNARRNNADLPEHAHVHSVGDPPEAAAALAGQPRAFTELFDAYTILIAVTEFSATAPLKLAARRHGFRAATMPGFGPAMIPALRLDWVEISDRCNKIKTVLDAANAADLRFSAEGRKYTLRLDLRHRAATASGGLITEPGCAGNLPSGETYIVPYEGELDGDASLSCGTLPPGLNQQINSLIVSDETYREYLFCDLCSRRDELQTLASRGSAQPILNKSDFSRLEVLRPGTRVLKAFHVMMRPVIARLASNIEESGRLAELRDTLLPKLLCGEIRVKDVQELTTAG